MIGFINSLINKFNNNIFYIIMISYRKKAHIQKTAKKRLGYTLNLINPQSYNEKINFRKLNDKNPLFDICSNKYLVRFYVESKIGSHILVPLIKVDDQLNTATIIDLPNQFVIKTSHGSGGNNVVIVNNKNDINWKCLIKKINDALKYDYGKMALEPWYSNTKRYVLIEELLNIDENTIEYKVYCFWKNGKFKCIIRVIHNRILDKSSSFYNKNWNYMKIDYNKDKLHKPIPKPKNFNDIINISKKLSEEFNHARVDLIVVNNQIYFGELTFADSSGFVDFKSKEIDVFFGKMW